MGNRRVKARNMRRRAGDKGRVAGCIGAVLGVRRIEVKGAPESSCSAFRSVRHRSGDLEGR